MINTSIPFGKPLIAGAIYFASSSITHLAIVNYRIHISEANIFESLNSKQQNHLPRHDSEFSLGLTNSKSIDALMSELGPLCVDAYIPKNVYVYCFAFGVFAMLSITAIKK